MKFPNFAPTKNFTIELEPPQSGTTYHAGQVVQGAIVVWNKEFDTSNLHSDLSLVAMAYGYVTWYKETNGNEPEQGSLHSEYYWKQNVPLTPHNRNDLSVVVFSNKSNGIRRLPFQLTLPKKIPSSYKAKHDNAEALIEYSLEAYLNNNSTAAEPKCVCNMTFEVEAAMADDRRTELVLIAPERSTYKRYSQMRSGWVKANLQLNRSCFLPGETILMDVKIENQSDKLAKWIKAKFVQYTTFTAEDESEKFEMKKVLWKTKWGRIRENETKEKHFVPILVPDVPPSPFPFCKIIQIRYTVELICDPDLLLPNLVIPVTIRTRNPVKNNRPEVACNKPLVGTPPFPTGVQHQREEFMKTLKVTELKQPAVNEYVQHKVLTRSLAIVP